MTLQLVNKIASVVYRLGLGPSLEIGQQLEARSGNVIVARIQADKRVYNDLELVNGRMAKIARGDTIVGALGCRRALHGFVGEVPDSISVGDELHLLNMGGVVGRARGVHRDLGPPARLEVLGMVVVNDRIVNVADAALPRVENLTGKRLPSLVLFTGTCMNSGKTFACSRVMRETVERGFRVHGAKLTGVACLRDSIAMEDHGAERTASFLDAGYTSTAGLEPDVLVRMARTVVADLLQGDPDVIFLELGDGVIGDYGVVAILEDPQLRNAVRAHVFCAGDMVGAWGGKHFLEQRSICIDLYSGPATDTDVGIEYIEQNLGAPAINAWLEPQRLAQEVVERLS
jgi:hypothetical protein